MSDFSVTKVFVKEPGAHPIARNLIVLMDGTWNDEVPDEKGDAVTNIVKMRRLLAPDSSDQITRYFRGVGNDEDNGPLHKFTKGATGWGESEIRLQAYARICQEYRPGDRIFIFGFSRGAASARMLASDINKKGIPHKFSVTTEPVGTKVSRHIEYKVTKFEPDGKAPDSDRKITPNVSFLGVWDTVYAMGIPVRLFGIPFHRYNLFSDKSVSSNVDRAVHLVGLDETRDAFQPTLMEFDERVHEVWFPGVHSDIGGGYVEDALGRLTLGYMLDQLDDWCSSAGLGPILYDAPMRSQFTNIVGPDFIFHFHGLGYKKSIRKVEVLGSNRKPTIHASLVRLQESPDVFSRQTKKAMFRSDREILRRIVYNPPNVKALMGGFDIVN